MLLGAIALAVISLYALTPGDASGAPYPTRYEEIVKEIKELEQFLVGSEQEFQRVRVYTRMIFWNSPMSDAAHEAIKIYNNWLYERRNAECRIKNLKNLLRNYEEISCTTIIEHAVAIGIPEE